MTNLRPIQNKVVVRRRQEEKVTEGGIHLPNATEKPEEGTVVAVGPGEVLDDGTLRETAVSVGDRVIFGKTVGEDVEFNDETLLVLNDKQIVAVIED